MDGIYDVNRGIMRRDKALFWTWFITVIFYGCSSTKPPTDTLAKAELSVRAAHEAGAEELAQTDLRKAREKLEQSQQAMAARNYDEARRFAEGAQVDAELAEAKADAAIVRRAADEVLRRVDALQGDTERNSRKSLTRGSDKE
jgi:predicted lipid-binding transport protein (Tim44 family)